MIASPSDVPNERQIVCDVIYEWNAIYAERTNIVLMPVGWETHASPAMGTRAQEIINKQVLDGCDLLVAAFWTRIGSPTGESPSGTVEEIHKHLNAGKPTMIYFSCAPVRPDSIDEEQYAALKLFKKECFNNGLVESYESLSDFKEKLTRQLAHTIIRYFASENLEVTTELEDSPKQEASLISEAAKQLLLEASEDPNGCVMVLHMMGGLHVQTNAKQFVEQGNVRSAAMWESAVSELCDFGLLAAQGYKNEVFNVTHKGYMVSDMLRADR